MSCSHCAERAVNMRSRWPILMLLCLMASLLVSGIASASTVSGAETRVRAFDLQDKAFIRVERSPTLELRQGCEATYDQLASDSLLATRGGARAVDAATPIGRRGNPINVPRGTNAPTTIGGREFSGHALDQMQGRGIVPSVVDDAIRRGGVPGSVPGTTAHFSSANNVTVIRDTASGRVVTVGFGRFGQ